MSIRDKCGKCGAISQNLGHDCLRDGLCPDCFIESLHETIEQLESVIKDLAVLCRRNMNNKERGKHAIRIAAKVGVTFSILRGDKK